MKKSTKILISAATPPVMMLSVLFLTAVSEFIFRRADIASIFEHILLIGLLVLLIYLDRKYVNENEELALSSAYFISALLFGLLIIPNICRLYLECDFYDSFCTKNAGLTGSNFSWSIYQLTIMVQTALFFIIRSVMSAVRQLKNYIKGK
ncbi:MAG: hypothetical protein IJ416_03595 [Ruminiclostridium sp.]|nr:hypothetical protein [Ruminiclostridium sp.]